MRQTPKGWAFPGTSRKAHYFNDSHDCLCGKWGWYFGEAEDTNDDHKDNCTQCVKKKTALDAKKQKA